MQLLLTYLVLFILGCMVGYVIEVLFRRFFSAKKWVNPGFMSGPWLPLYGFGVVVMFSMCLFCYSIFPEDVIVFYNPMNNLFDRKVGSGPTWADLIPISMMWIGMVLLELVAGLIFIKKLHVKLWDYSNIKGNFKGIICPLFSAIWLVVSVIFYYLVDPILYVVAENVHTYIFGGNGMVANVGIIFAIGLVYGIFIYDLVVSLNIFKFLREFAQDKGIADRYESMREKFSSVARAARKKVPFHMPQKEDENEHSRIAILKEKFIEAMYIDPEKEKHKENNYDESGRPIKITDDNTNKESEK
ncbi:MAG: putative ABC transporter permease [Acholeplasmatales bacterium]|nr:putative ABC transporter permease [Acholeplasmatales bacterium]